MAKKSLGYVELEWVCPNCDTKNPGSRRICANCGTPQPDTVEFRQANQAELVTDEAKLKVAKAGPDIHCYYCGTRNPATAETCSQCGADLSEGARRKYGHVLGQKRASLGEPVLCPNCDHENAPNAEKCANCGASLAQAKPKPRPLPQPRATPQPATLRSRRTGLFGGGMILAIILVLCIGIPLVFAVLSLRTSDLTGQVQQVGWQREIAIQGLVPVTRQDWRSNIPIDIPVSRCTERLHHTQDSPAPNSVEVCQAPVVIDQGSGFGEVVQECRYEVYAPYCDYTVQEWQTVDTVTASGSGFSPAWPALSLDYQEQEGERTETYEVVFNTESGRYVYTTNNLAEYSQFEIGSRWNLQVNTFNAVVSVEPAQ